MTYLISAYQSKKKEEENIRTYRIKDFIVLKYLRIKLNDN